MEKETEILLQKAAEKHMLRFVLPSFKETYPRLYKTIIEAIIQALIKCK